MTVSERLTLIRISPYSRATALLDFGQFSMFWTSDSSTRCVYGIVRVMVRAAGRWDNNTCDDAMQAANA
jgi:hypothetical protein